MLKYFFLLFLSFLSSYLMMPWLINFANKYRFTDKPTKRKKHKKPVPLIGGIGIFIGFFLVYLFFINKSNQLKNTLIIFIAALMVLIIGLIDDYYKSIGKEFPIMPRLIVHLSAAILVYKVGIVFSGTINPISGEYILFPGIIKFLLTITWIFGVTTVINWSDGMDGLAGSISIISALTMFVVGVAKGQINSSIMSICLIGAIVGFLRFNTHPAKVFMGDSGANFLGFMLAIIALDGAFKQTTVLSILIPILALGVPIFDNIFVVVKRFYNGKPIYMADRSQIHYRLQERGMSISQIVSYICFLSGTLSFISLIILFIRI